MILGKFSVVIRIRLDNPAFPQYLVYDGQFLVGKQFSVPTLSDCEWLARQQAVGRLVYAEQSSRLFEHSVQPTGCHRGRKHRVTFLVEEESA